MAAIPAVRSSARGLLRPTTACQLPLQPMAATMPRPAEAMLKNGRAFVSEERPAVGPKRTTAFSARLSVTGAKSLRSALLPRAR